eukprot:492803-Hanusia_phi.AAC.2
MAEPRRAWGGVLSLLLLVSATFLLLLLSQQDDQSGGVELKLTENGDPVPPFEHSFPVPGFDKHSLQSRVRVSDQDQEDVAVASQSLPVSESDMGPPDEVETNHMAQASMGIPRRRVQIPDL